MRTSDLSLSILATLTSFLVTAAPLSSTCRCATPPSSSLASLPLPKHRILTNSFFCQILCERVSENFPLNLEETKAHVKLEDLDALPAPIDPTERPLPTSLLMQLSSQSENKPSAPSQTATPTLYYEILSGQEGRLGGRFGHRRVYAQFEGFEQRHLVILLGLLALFLVAVALVESVEQLWKRRPCAIFPRWGRIMLDDDCEGLLAQDPEWDELYDEKMEL